MNWQSYALFGFINYGSCPVMTLSGPQSPKPSTSHPLSSNSYNPHQTPHSKRVLSYFSLVFVGFLPILPHLMTLLSPGSLAMICCHRLREEIPSHSGSMNTCTPTRPWHWLRPFPRKSHCKNHHSFSFNVSWV